MGSGLIIQKTEDMDEIKNRYLRDCSRYKYRVLVCAGSGCISSNCQLVKEALIRSLKRKNVAEEVLISDTGCIGDCSLGPAMIVYPGEVLYTRLAPHLVEDIVESHLVNGMIKRECTYFDVKRKAHVPLLKDIDYFKNQVRIALKNCGRINFDSLEEYIANDGYSALSKVLGKMEPADVIREVKKSGLRGRGGGGFSTGMKWELGREAKGGVKYIVCNADEGDPGAYMDRSMLEGDPHSVLEGMLIAGFAIGAGKGYIYTRAEYPLALERLERAISAAREAGLLGKDILGSSFDFDVEIRIGEGAFVCGEETALMASIEGRRGEPEQKPPYPFEQGLFGKPTVINNVETLVNVPRIILNGSEWYAQLGTHGSKGTKVFTLSGSVNNAGVIEVPMGVTPGDIVFGIGGGVKNNKPFKALQIGGPSGSCITRDHLNTPMDYESLSKLGAMMGSGGLVVLDEDTCMVDMARYFMEFVRDESCGKCVPCRIGTKRMAEILERITKGHGHEEDVELLEELGHMIKEASVCGLGQTAPNAILTTVRQFHEEYTEHVQQGRCRAGVCESMFLSPCANACPAGVNVPGYLALVAAGRIREAYNLIRKENPFPAVCGRVCTHPCESKCKRGLVDEAIAISDMKRYITDYVFKNEEPYMDLVFPKKGRSVGIIGAGPSGLTCGYYLARLGYDVEVYEAHPMAGGLLAFGIPEFKLPKDILQHEIGLIERVGVKIHLNTEVGTDISLYQLRNKHDAVYIATGTQFPHKINIPGEELKEVHYGMDFLMDVSLGKKPKVGNTVAVIGGGNTSVDAARTALRLGAKKVYILTRRQLEDMPAVSRDIAEALEEGIEIIPMVMPVRFIGKDKVTAVECIKMELGEFDATARRKPKPVHGSEFTLKVDMVIPAITAFSDLPFINRNELEVTQWGTFVADKDNLMTKMKGVFAGGDVIRGSDTAITAIADGKKAAKSIDVYLGGAGLLNTGEDITIPVPMDDRQIVEHGRYPMRYLEPDRRKRSFEEVAVGFYKLNAVEEAMRCLRCDRRT